jgi:hypothetical protein
MRFLSIYKSPETNQPPSPEFFEKMGRLIEESMKAGTLIATEGCLPSIKGARVRMVNGQVTVTDGPFTEAKEVVGGFAILEARSKEHAIELAREFLAVAGDGECEIRQIAETPGDCGPEYAEGFGEVAQPPRIQGATAR